MYSALEIDPKVPDDLRELFQRLSRELEYVTSTNSYTYTQDS